MFADFCDDWDSTKTQDDFIEQYFGKRKANSSSYALKSIDKSKSVDVSENFINKSVNKHSLNYEEECIKKKRKEKQALYTFSPKNCSEISVNVESTETLNCETSNFKNKKRKSKVMQKNVSSDLSEQLENTEDFNDKTKVIDHFAEDPLKDDSYESIESNFNCQKVKKRKIAKSNYDDESLMSNKLFVERDSASKTKFSDSLIKDNNVPENKSDTNCSKKKKKKMKNTQKHSTHGEFSCGESTSLKNSYDLSVKQNNVTEINSDTLFNDSVMNENNLPRNDSKSLKKKKNKNKFKNKSKLSEQDEFSIEEEPVNSEGTYDLSAKKSSLLQNKAYQKLQAAKFRYLNEMLYTNSGKESLTYFQQNNDEFLDYHAGYQSQVSKWPVNPVDIIIQEISKINKQAVIADLGCGEAKIAEVFPKRTVHSFDLIALKDCVTACDMANVPLPSNSVDVVIFCLSLMGTNWKDFLKEGQRILKLGGMMEIAEIESRIENVQNFIKKIESFGFSLINQNLTHKMFVFLNFKRVSRSKKSSKVPEVTLKPCLYKKR